MIEEPGDIKGEFIIKNPTDNVSHMEPCTQAQNIQDISKAIMAQDRESIVRDGIVQAISKSLLGLEATMKEQTQLLKDYSAQNVRITHLEKVEVTIEGHFTELFNRMRAVEKFAEGNTAAVKLEIIEGLTETKKDVAATDKQLDRIVLFVSIIGGKPFLTVVGLLVGLIIIGTICDFAYHRTLADTLFEWVPK